MKKKIKSIQKSLIEETNTHGKSVITVYFILRFLVILCMILEFLRGDNRGASPIPFLTPSQFTSVIMILGAIAIFIIRKMILDKELKQFYNNNEKIGFCVKSPTNKHT